MLTKSCVTDDEAKKDKILAPFDECINYIQVHFSTFSTFRYITF